MFRDVKAVSRYLDEKLQSLVEQKSIVKETRGLGLMRGLELKEPVGPYISKALEEGVIFMSAGTHVIRFIPPLVIEKKHVDEMISVLERIL